MIEKELTSEEKIALLEQEINKLQKEIDLKDQKILEQANEYDKLEGEFHVQQLVVEELLDIIERKEFQRVSQILRSYGIKSEKTDVLVNEAEEIDTSTSNEEKEEAKEIEDVLKGKSKKGKPGRKVGTLNYQDYDFSKIPTRDVYLDDSNEHLCDVCGSTMSIDGEEITTKLVWHPGSFEFIKYHQERYKCPRCDEKTYKENIDIFNDNLVTPSLAANIINYKYNYAIPLYRQEDIYKKFGVPLSRISLSKYILLAADVLTPIYELMIQHLINTPCKVLQADETSFKCILDSKIEDRDKNYVFTYSTTYYDRRIRIYSYSQNRGVSNPQEMLKEFVGYLEVDGYDGYNNINNVKTARCWVHARRKYSDIVKSLKENQKKGSIAFKLVKKINELFKLEEEYKKKKLTPKQILEVRKEKSHPIVDEYFAYIKSIKDEVGKPLIDAINYSLDLEEGLRMFLEDGHIPLDNNLSERTVKPFVIMRKNALFAYSHGGAIASCILMSIVQTAKENCLDVEKYLAYVFEQMNSITTSKLIDLLPYSTNLPKDLVVNIK